MKPRTIANQIDTARTLSCGPMRRARVVSLLLIAIAACRTPRATPAGPHEPAPADAATAPPVDAAIAPPVAAPLTEAECVRLVEHTLEVGMAQQRASKPAELVPTADQLGAIRTRLIASRPCAGLTRPQWQCALDATTQDAMYRCAQ